MSPNETKYNFNRQFFWDARARESDLICNRINAQDYCSIAELLVVLAHFYQAVDSYLREYPIKGLAAEDVAPALKTIRLWYAHPEDERFRFVKTTCEAVSREIKDMQVALLRHRRFPLNFFTNVLQVVSLYESQWSEEE